MSHPTATAPGQTPETACCSPAEKATCCAPEEKAGCCGSDSASAASPGAPTRCGCR